MARVVMAVPLVAAPLLLAATLAAGGIPCRGSQLLAELCPPRGDCESMTTHDLRAVVRQLESRLEAVETAQTDDTPLGTPIDIAPPAPPVPPSPALNVEEICADGVAPFGGQYPFWGTDTFTVSIRNLLVAFKQCPGCPPPYNWYPALSGCPRGFVVGFEGLEPFDTTESLITPGGNGTGSACRDETCVSLPRPARAYLPGVTYAPVGVYLKGSGAYGAAAAANLQNLADGRAADEVDIGVGEPIDLAKNGLR